MWAYTCRQRTLLHCMLGDVCLRTSNNVSVSLVVIGEPVVPGLAGQAINCPGHSASVADPIVHNAGSYIVWKQEREDQQGPRLHPPPPLLTLFHSTPTCLSSGKDHTDLTGGAVCGASAQSTEATGNHGYSGCNGRLWGAGDTSLRGNPESHTFIRS